jgi:hypothetical protein
VVDVRRHRWWTLRSESLEILPTDAWRIMAILTAAGTPGMVELHLEVDREASRPDWLVLRGRGARAAGLRQCQAGLDPHSPDPDRPGRARRVEDRIGN